MAYIPAIVSFRPLPGGTIGNTFASGEIGTSMTVVTSVFKVIKEIECKTKLPLKDLKKAFRESDKGKNETKEVAKSLKVSQENLGIMKKNLN